MRPEADNELSLPNSCRSLLPPPPLTASVFKCLKCFCIKVPLEKEKQGNEGGGALIFKMSGVGDCSTFVYSVLCVKVLGAASSD